VFFFEVVKTRPRLSGERETAMVEMLAGLSPDERQMLEDPDFITEDEADLIYSDRAMAEPGERISLHELLAENGIPRRRRSA